MNAPRNCLPDGFTRTRADADRHRELARRARSGDADARNAMVESVLPLVAKLARRYVRRDDPADAFQEAALAVVGAAERYDPDAEACFVTYAHACARGGLLQSFRRAKRDTPPGGRTLSLDAPLSRDPDASTLAAAVAAPRDADPGERLDARDLLRTLHPRERAAVEGRCRGESSTDIGRRMGIRRSRVGQLHARGVERMRRRVEREPDRSRPTPLPQGENRRPPRTPRAATATRTAPSAPAHLGNPQVDSPPDLDAAERLVAPLLARTAGTGRARTTDVRAVLEAVSWKLRTGRGWRDLPDTFPPWQTCYRDWRRFVKAGLGAELRRLLEPPAGPGKPR